MNFFRIALSLNGIEILFHAHVANGKAEKKSKLIPPIVFLQLALSNCFSNMTAVIIIKRGKILEAEHEVQRARIEN